jgi:hypothetical protein
LPTTMTHVHEAAITEAEFVALMKKG